jgi:hypothetical protein
LEWSGVALDSVLVVFVLVVLQCGSWFVAVLFGCWAVAIAVVAVFVVSVYLFAGFVGCW